MQQHLCDLTFWALCQWAVGLYLVITAIKLILFVILSLCGVRIESLTL